MVDLIIVDDEHLVLDIAVEHAKLAGLSVEGFTSLNEAQGYLDTQQEIPSRYLLDMHFPGGEHNQELGLRNLYARLLDQGIQKDQILLFSGRISDDDLTVIDLMDGAMTVRKLFQIPSQHPNLTDLFSHCEYFHRWAAQGKPVDSYTLVDFIRETGLPDQSHLPVQDRMVTYRSMLDAMDVTL
jgi:hypothetical protein